MSLMYKMDLPLFVLHFKDQPFRVVASFFPSFLFALEGIEVDCTFYTPSIFEVLLMRVDRHTGFYDCRDSEGKG